MLGFKKLRRIAIGKHVHYTAYQKQKINASLHLQERNGLLYPTPEEGKNSAVFPPSRGWEQPLVVDKKGGDVYLEQVTAQNFQPLLGIFHAFQLWILIQHALENVQEKLQRELVQEMHLEEEKAY